MPVDKVLEYWNERAALAARAGSDDLVAKELEIRAISSQIRDGATVAEFGCGNGTTALELLQRHDIELHCFDFSPAMIDAAREQAERLGLADRVQFNVCDVRSEPVLSRKFDLIYTERMIINLPDWAAQAKAINYLISNLVPKGRYLMCENSRTGLDNLNGLRVAAGLDPISPPWHNVYLDDAKVAGLEMPSARLAEVQPFSATYYFLSRVVNAWLAKREGASPSYDAPVNRLALDLPPFGDCAQGKLWVFERN